MAMSDELVYYANHSRMTSPGVHAALFNELPGAVDELCAVVRGLLLHPIDAQFMGVAIAPERMPQERIRSIEARLANIQTLDPAPLTAERPFERRSISQCYGFATLLCSMLRQRGVAARVRSGFATYLTSPGLVYNHWITEYWQADQSRWRLTDPQYDQEFVETVGGSFDVRDIPRDVFLSADLVWSGCRAGELEPQRYGFDEVRGLGYIGYQLLGDVAALNKVELLATDRWGVGLKHEQERTPEDWALLDRVAVLAQSGTGFEELRAIYEADQRLRVPDDLG